MHRLGRLPKCRFLFSHSVEEGVADILHFYQGNADADAVDPRPHFVEQGSSTYPPLTGGKTARRWGMTFPRYFIRLEEVSQASLPVSCHLTSFMIQAHSSRRKCFLNFNVHLQPGCNADSGSVGLSWDWEFSFLASSQLWCQCCWLVGPILVVTSWIS